MSLDLFIFDHAVVRRTLLKHVGSSFLYNLGLSTESLFLIGPKNGPHREFPCGVQKLHLLNKDEDFPLNLIAKTVSPGPDV